MFNQEEFTQWVKDTQSFLIDGENQLNKLLYGNYGKMEELNNEK